MNKALLPIIRDDDNFKAAAPALFGKEFAQQSKELVDQVRAMRFSLTHRLGPGRRPQFFRGGGDYNTFIKTSRGGGYRGGRDRPQYPGKNPIHKPPQTQ